MLIKKVLIITAIFVMLAIMVSCGEHSSVGQITYTENISLDYILSQPCNSELLYIVHEDELLGLRIEMPLTWVDNHSIEPINWPSDMSAYDRAGREGINIRTSWGGLLFQIIRHPTNKWHGIENLPPVRNEIILETGDYIFVMTWPSDVHWRDSDEEAVYRQMTEEISDIRFSIYRTC